jgi:hypothetical protein
MCDVKFIYKVFPCKITIPQKKWYKLLKIMIFPTFLKGVLKTPKTLGFWHLLGTRFILKLTEKSTLKVQKTFSPTTPLNPQFLYILYNKLIYNIIHY